MSDGSCGETAEGRGRRTGRKGKSGGRRKTVKDEWESEVMEGRREG